MSAAKQETIESRGWDFIRIAAGGIFEVSATAPKENLVVRGCESLAGSRFWLC